MSRAAARRASHGLYNDVAMGDDRAMRSSLTWSVAALAAMAVIPATPKRG